MSSFGEGWTTIAIVPHLVSPRMAVPAGEPAAPDMEYWIDRAAVVWLGADDVRAGPWVSPATLPLIHDDGPSLIRL